MYWATRGVDTGRYGECRNLEQYALGQDWACGWGHCSVAVGSSEVRRSEEGRSFHLGPWGAPPETLPASRALQWVALCRGQEPEWGRSKEDVATRSGRTVQARHQCASLAGSSPQPDGRADIPASSQVASLGIS